MSSEEKEEPTRQKILGLWRSPLRGLWLTSMFSVVLLGGMILLIVTGLLSLFEIVTGLLNIQYWYAFPFSFYTAHFYGAWVTIIRSCRSCRAEAAPHDQGPQLSSLRNELRTPLEATHPEDAGDDELVASDPRPATISRRGLLGAVGAGSAALLVTTVGQTLGGPFRNIALLLHGAATRATGPTTFRSTRPLPIDTSSRAFWSPLRPEARRLGQSWPPTHRTGRRPSPHEPKESSTSSEGFQP